MTQTNERAAQQEAFDRMYRRAQTEGNPGYTGARNAGGLSRWAKSFQAGGGQHEGASLAQIALTKEIMDTLSESA